MAQGAGAVAGGIKGIGDISAGNNKRAALERAAQVQRMDAQEALQAGEINAARQGMIADQKIGSTEAGYGASGVTESGSVLHVLEASHKNAELDVMGIRYGAKIRAVNFMNQASMDELAGQNAQIAGYFDAFSDVIGASGKALSYAVSGGGGTPGATVPAGEE